MAVAVLVLAGCSVTPTPTPDPAPAPGKPIDSLVYSQYQAIEGFDDSEFTQHEPAEVTRFMALLDEYGVEPGVTDITPDEQCDGGLSTSVAITYSDGTTTDMIIESCGESDYSDFTREASDLFSEWRAAAGG